MFDQFQKIESDKLLSVVGWRGGTLQQDRCVLLELSVATTENELRCPKKITLCIDQETAQKVISSIQQSLSILRQSN